MYVNHGKIPAEHWHKKSAHQHAHTINERGRYERFCIQNDGDGYAPAECPVHHSTDRRVEESLSARWAFAETWRFSVWR